jgi:predicted Zn-dependent peptidase
MNIVTLSNGIRVVVEKLSYLRTASFGVWVNVGSAKETKENNGISHMIEHMLFKGTNTKTGKVLADIIAMIGDDVNAFTGKEITCYYGTTTSENLTTLVELIADMMLHSNFDASDISKEKSIICDEIDMYEDSADDLVHELLQQKVYINQALGYIISGTKTNVRSFSKQQLLDFMKLHYTADKILISVAGNFEEEQLIQTLEESFKEIKTVNQGALIAASKYKLNDQHGKLSPYEKKYDNSKIPKYHPCFCTKHKENEQLHINIAYPSITLKSEESVVFSIFNSMFGGSNNSRLFQRIREELSLVYSIYSYGSFFEEAGLFHIDITVNPNKALVVLKETKQAIENFLSKGIDLIELNTHKSQVKTEYIMSCESAKSRMDSNAKGVLLRGYIKSIDEVITEIDRVTIEDIIDFAKHTFLEQIPSMCVVGAETGISFQKIKKYFINEFRK